MHAIESRAITRTSPAHATCGPARASAAACLDSLAPHSHVTTEAPRHVKSVLSACRPRAPPTFRACTRRHRTISYYTDSMKVSLLLLAIGAEAAWPIDGAARRWPVNGAARRLFPNKAAPSVSVPVKHRRKLDECASTLYFYCYKEDDCEVRRERSLSSRSLAEMPPGPVVPSGLSHLANAAKCQHLPAPARRETTPRRQRSATGRTSASALPMRATRGPMMCKSLSATVRCDAARAAAYRGVDARGAPMHARSLPRHHRPERRDTFRARALRRSALVI